MIIKFYMVMFFLFVLTNCMQVHVEPPQIDVLHESKKASLANKLTYFDPFLANKFTYFDHRFYNPTNTQEIIEYFYPKNSPELNDSSYLIFQIFEIKYSQNQTFCLTLWKDGSLTYKSSVPFESKYFGFENFSKEIFENWKENVFSMSVLPFGNILILNKKLKVQVVINCFLGETPKVSFSAVSLDPTQYFTVPPYLGFSQMRLIDGKLRAYKYSFKNKHLNKIEEKISNEEFIFFEHLLQNNFLTEAILPDLFDISTYEESNHDQNLSISSVEKKKNMNESFFLTRLCSKLKLSSCKKPQVKQD